jgi:DNA-binding IclR family transcriptional regulator
MTDLDLIRNCVLQIRRPFDAAMIASLTGVDMETVASALHDLEQRGSIKRISCDETIWVRANRYTRPTSPDDLPWAVYSEKAIPLLDLIEKQSFSNGRKIAKALGMSHQWVYVYLKALVSAGVVRKTRGRYVVVKRGNLRLLDVECGRAVLRMKMTASTKHRMRKVTRRLVWNVLTR